MPSTFVIEPLDKSKHDRAAFVSGVPQVDRFLKETAAKLMAGGTARVYVLVDLEQNPAEILGFYAINAHRIEVGVMPNRYKRYALSDGSIPAAFIGMMGVAQAVQGQGIGSCLLADALGRAHSASLQVGTAVVLLDVLDCGDIAAVTKRQRLYKGFGFQPLVSNPLRMFIPMTTIAQLLKE